MAQPEKLEAGRTASPRKRQLGRPTVDRTAAIDAAIRESALAIFLELGFDGASMDAVAAQAGVSKGTLYARFANKEVLFRAMLAEEFGRWSKRAEGEDHLLPAALGPRLRHHARSMAEAYAQPEHARIYRLIQTAAATLPNAAREWQEAAADRFLSFLARDMAGAWEGEEIDWDFYAKLFFFAIAGFLSHQDVGEKGATPEFLTFADGVIETLQRALSEGSSRHASPG